MGYDYDRRRVASKLDTLAKAADQRNDVLGKASRDLQRIGDLGARFDTKDRVKLTKLCENVLKVGETTEKVAQRLVQNPPEENDATEPVTELLEAELRSWRLARTDMLLAQRDGRESKIVYEGKNAAAEAGLLNSYIIDFANAVKHNDPDMPSVQLEQSRKF